jgi:hypothetical protein
VLSNILRPHKTQLLYLLTHLVANDFGQLLGAPTAAGQDLLDPLLGMLTTDLTFLDEVAN